MRCSTSSTHVATPSCGTHVVTNQISHAYALKEKPEPITGKRRKKPCIKNQQTTRKMKMTKKTKKMKEMKEMRQMNKDKKKNAVMKS